VFPVRYELKFYVLFRRNSLFKMLTSFVLSYVPFPAMSASRNGMIMVMVLFKLCVFTATSWSEEKRHMAGRL
jgi:hypothetical protein